MSDTPRTDALLDPPGTEHDMNDLCRGFNEMLEHARGLERESAAQAARIRTLTWALEAMLRRADLIEDHRFCPEDCEVQKARKALSQE